MHARSLALVLSLHQFTQDQHFVIIIGWLTLKSYMYVYGPQWMNRHDCGDPLTFFFPPD